MGVEDLVTLVKKIEDITDKLIELLSKTKLENSDFDKISFNLDKRESEIRNIEALNIKKNAENAEIIDRIMEKDKQMNKMALSYKEELKFKIENGITEKKIVGKKKNANRKYMNSQVQRDGYFIDSKK